MVFVLGQYLKNLVIITQRPLPHRCAALCYVSVLVWGVGLRKKRSQTSVQICGRPRRSLFCLTENMEGTDQRETTKDPRQQRSPSDSHSLTPKMAEAAIMQALWRHIQGVCSHRAFSFDTLNDHKVPEKNDAMGIETTAKMWMKQRSVCCC